MKKQKEVLVMQKGLIAYFSHRGNSYVSGNIINLPVGNTEVAAKMIQGQTGGELFQISTVAAYPKDYHETTEVAAAKDSIVRWIKREVK